MEESATAAAAEAAVSAAGPPPPRKSGCPPPAVAHQQQTTQQHSEQTSVAFPPRKDSSSSISSLLVLSVANLGSSQQSGPSSLASSSCAPTDESLSRDFDPRSCQQSSCTNSGPESLSSVSSADDVCDSASSRAMMAAVPLAAQAVIPSNNNNCGGKVSADVAGLQGALASLQEKLTCKDKEIARLSRIREDVEAELEDLTASLFEEAHRMVREANVKQASAEKALVEARMAIDGLETEVSALKTLVLTSTPSQPNKHLHPQLNPKKKKENGGGSSESVKSSSVNGFENGSLSPVVGGKNPLSAKSSLSGAGCEEEEDEPTRNIDPLLRMDYLSWKKAPTLDPTHPFLARIYREDIDLCLDFPNRELIRRVTDAIHANSLCLSPVKDFSNIPRNCALLDSPVLCKYVLRLTGGAEEELFHISQLARNRLAAVCDFLTYARYVHQGLVKSHVNDVYWEIMKLRRHMVVARLGFSPCD